MRRLYELIWKRAVACQMVPATSTPSASTWPPARSTASAPAGTTVVDPGFLAVYEEGKDRRPADDDDEGRKLPAMKRRRRCRWTHPHRPALHRAAAALLRSLAGQDAGGIRHRPALDLRQHHPDPAVPRVRGARQPPLPPERRRPRGGQVPHRPLHPLRRLRLHRQARGRARRGQRGEEDWVPLMERFWKPFKALVDDKSQSVDRSEATGARVLGIRPGERQAGQRAAGPLRAVRADRHHRGRDKPTFASLRPGQSMHTIALADALELFKLPRTLGEDGGERSRSRSAASAPSPSAAAPTPR
jgi:DNA topoisomerase I